MISFRVDGQSGVPPYLQIVRQVRQDFVWAQSVTRMRWLTVKTGWLLLAAACGGAIAALTTWWSGPANALSASAFDPGQFDTQDIVPIG